MFEQAMEIINLPYLKPVAIIILSVVAGYLAEWIIRKTLVQLAKKTATTLDDNIVEILRRPIVLSIVFMGLAIAIKEMQLPVAMPFVSFAMLKTLGVWIWSIAATRIFTLILRALAGRPGGSAILQRRTLPFFDIMLKVVVIGWAIYFGLLAWNINVTGWLASAGVVGIAVGFAAKDTLANLFAGIFILADAPYKLGDIVVVDENLRGKVSQIGIRTTRIVTLDGIEITIPNAVIGNDKIINESGGLCPGERVRPDVWVAYGSRVDQVRDILLACADVEGVDSAREAEVRFREMGNSGLRFQLLVWINDPEQQGPVLDRLNTRIYTALGDAGIEIPYPKHDLYIREMPKAKV
jgi:small-conductance mechanosensitive channel